AISLFLLCHEADRLNPDSATYRSTDSVRDRQRGAGVKLPGGPCCVALMAFFWPSLNSFRPFAWYTIKPMAATIRTIRPTSKGILLPSNELHLLSCEPLGKRGR